MKHRFTVSEKESEVQFHRVSQDLLTHNPKQGVNYWGGAEYPTMLIWAGRIYDFLRVLEGIVGHYPARMQSYTVGYTSGWNGADVGARLLTDAPANDGKSSSCPREAESCRARDGAAAKSNMTMRRAKSIGSSRRGPRSASRRDRRDAGTNPPAHSSPASWRAGRTDRSARRSSSRSRSA